MTSTFGVHLAWWGQACVIGFIDAFIVCKGLVDNTNNTILTPLAHERYKNAGFEMKSES